MIEEWKLIEEYGDKYMISNMGRVKRKSITSNTYCIAALHTNKDGYLIYCFYNKGERNTMMIHRLVAKYFIPNPNNLPVVNHINENKADARCFNLEWCSQKYNMNVGTIKSRKRKSLMANAEVTMRPVVLLNTGEVFNNINRASEETGIGIESIMKSCIGRSSIYDDQTFCDNVMFLYYEEIRDMLKDKHSIDVYAEY